MINKTQTRDIDSIKSQYQKFINNYNTTKNTLDRRSLVFSISRFIVFILAAIIIYKAITIDSSLLWIIAATLIIIFLFLMKLHSKLFTERKFIKNLIKINTNELSSLEGDNSNFADGKQFEIDYHDFSLDLDIFGPDSIYQKTNRTTSIFGSKNLAHWLNNPLLNAKDIIARHKASTELSNKVVFRQEYCATGMMVDESIKESKTGGFEFLQEWKNHSNLFYSKAIFKLLIILIPIINIGAMGLFSFDIINGKAISFLLIATLVFVGFFQKKIHKIHLNLSKRSTLLDKYVELFLRLENEDFKSDLLISFQKKLQTNKHTASQAIGNLSKILSALDSRLNVFVGILLNMFLIWDIRQILRMEEWKETYAQEVEVWFNTIGEFDAMISLANLQYNNPEWILPQVSDNNQWKISEMRHPLMAMTECISNDFEVNQTPYIKVITGANMAGKSTFLRSVGSNLVLAMTGAVVNAKQMIFMPMQIVSSLRTTDSLSKSESYFYAEIKRLKMIVDRLRDDEKLFVLLDEILKGTNSNDKEQGSRDLLEQLLKLNAVAIIATHDLSLGNMSSKFPNKIENQCFEVDIIDDQLSFDYKLRQGIAQNMNASFLLRKMGIVGDLPLKTQN